MKKTVIKTPNISSKKYKNEEEIFQTIQKKPNTKTTNLSEATPKEEDYDFFPILTLRGSSRFIENSLDFKKEIEKRYKKSVVNKIYSFPRDYDSFSNSSSSLNSLKNTELYNLDSQNSHNLKISSLRKSSRERDCSSSISRNKVLFEKEINRLTKEIEYYKNYAEKKEKEKLSSGKKEKNKKIEKNSSKEENEENYVRGRKPHYVQLLKVLEENNEKEVRESLSKSKRNCSNSKNSKTNHSKYKEDLSLNKYPSLNRKIAKIFENCCEPKEDMNLFNEISFSDYRSISRGKSNEKSRSPLKAKHENIKSPPNCRVHSPANGYTYMSK